MATNLAAVVRAPPSFSSGFARSAGESAHTGLWKGLVGAWVPALGPTGETLRDVSGHHNHGTLDADMDPATDWVMTEHGAVLDFDGTNDDVVIPSNQSMDVEHITMMMLLPFVLYQNRYHLPKQSNRILQHSNILSRNHFR